LDSFCEYFSSLQRGHSLNLQFLADLLIHSQNSQKLTDRTISPQVHPVNRD
jgi:hypothetical protein